MTTIFRFPVPDSTVKPKLAVLTRGDCPRHDVALILGHHACSWPSRPYYFIGVDEGMTSVFGKTLVIHEWVHDSRHFLGFPCH